MNPIKVANTLEGSRSPAAALHLYMYSAGNALGMGHALSILAGRKAWPPSACNISQLAIHFLHSS